MKQPDAQSESRCKLCNHTGTRLIHAGMYNELRKLFESFSAPPKEELIFVVRDRTGNVRFEICFTCARGIREVTQMIYEADPALSSI